ncbi:uncharacterized protein V1516DRAFT_671867 [Lipomyces oligophaga]|uniref:uncharacterized protein n=1 Tax=Lipomyces oligophaga TaxID=45792 RepID=UPI0034CDB350
MESSPSSSSSSSPISSLESPVDVLDTPISVISIDGIPEYPDERVIFIPLSYTPLPKHVFGDLTANWSKSLYKLPGYSVFHPEFASGNSCLVRTSGDQVTGRLLFLPMEKLSTFDAWEEEGKTKFRLECTVKSESVPAFYVPAEAYVWNGNSLVGEFQYM